jgi:hypothetical protein
MEDQLKDRLIKTILGKHYMNNFGVINTLNDFPRKLLKGIWPNPIQAERYFARYTQLGRLVWIRKNQSYYMIHIPDSGNKIIVDGADREISPESFENILGF